MARPTLSKHRKFRELALVLKSRALAWGSLELIWECGYDSGDPVIGSAAAVEVAADWRGRRGALASALVTTGFLDLREDGTHIIHDLFDHMPEYVEKRMKRELNRNIKGVTVGELRAEAGKKGAERRWQMDGKRMANGEQLPDDDDGKRMANGGTRARALAPALSLTLAPGPPGATAPLGEQRIASDPVRTAEQPEEPMPPEAAEFFAAIASIGRPPGQRANIDLDERRELLDRQKLVLLGGGAT